MADEDPRGEPFADQIEDVINRTGPAEWDPLNVVAASVIVAGEHGDDRAVGAILSHGSTHVIGVVPNTPAGDAGIRRVAGILDLPIDWDEVRHIDENRTAQAWIVRAGQPPGVDARWRLVSIAFLWTMGRWREVGEKRAMLEFEDLLDDYLAKIKDWVREHVGREAKAARRPR